MERKTSWAGSMSEFEALDGDVGKICEIALDTQQKEKI